MYAATKSNTRTAAAAQDKGAATGSFQSHFMVGSIMGLCVASLGLLGLGGLFFFLGEGSLS